jgi:hypothetical protein
MIIADANLSPREIEEVAQQTKRRGRPSSEEGSRSKLARVEEEE